MSATDLTVWLIVEVDEDGRHTMGIFSNLEAAKRAAELGYGVYPESWRDSGVESDGTYVADGIDHLEIHEWGVWDSGEAWHYAPPDVV